jgi:hypothetical protein
MNDVERLLGWFDAGDLRRPDPLAPGTVHLSRALAALCGAPLQLNEPETAVAAAIGEPDHVVFVLADGLGMNLIRDLPGDSFLRRHLAMELRSVFPSSTAPARTALATGLWPAKHGVPAWLTYLPDRNLQTVTLPYTERFTAKPLDEAGLDASDLFTQPVLAASYTRDAAFCMNRRIAGSVYTRYVSGGHPQLPYDKVDAAAEVIADRIGAASEATYTHLYYPDVDSALHLHGPSSKEVSAAIARIDAALAALHDATGDRARIVVSADHGGYEVSPDQKLIVEPGDGLSELLVTPHAGEAPVPIFHVRPSHAADFAAKFRATAGDAYALLSVDEVDDLRLLGPEPLSATTRSRLGDFIALSAHGESVVYSLDTTLIAMKGFHGGLMPDEVDIPLVVA